MPETKPDSAPPPYKAPEPGRMRERLSFAWAMSCFGVDRARSRKERSMRILEEAIELAQACGHTRGDCVRQVEETYAKPIGEIKQEVSGVLVTVAAFCGLMGLNMDELFTKEFCRCIEKSDEIKAKSLKKSVVFDSQVEEDD